MPQFSKHINGTYREYSVDFNAFSFEVEYDQFGVILDIYVASELGFVKIDLRDFELNHESRYLYVQTRVNEALHYREKYE